MAIELADHSTDERGQRRSKAERRQAKEAVDDGANAFRKAERYWKSKMSPPDVRKAFVAADVESWDDGEGAAEGIWYNGNESTAPVYRVPLIRLSSAQGLQSICPLCAPASSRYGYAFPQQPGLVLLPGLLCEHAQVALAKSCFSEAARPPHRNNLDALYEPHEEGLYRLWERWRGRHQDEDETAFILEPRLSRLLPPPLSEPPSPSSRRVSAAAQIRDALEQTRADLIPSKPLHVRDLWDEGKLRWSVLGWQYDWATKRYDWSLGPTPMPTTLTSLCMKAVGVTPWRRVFVDEKEGDDAEVDAKRYKPDAAIVNFYQTKHTLTAHQDESEVSASTPLVSLSVGQSCIFLVSPSKDSPPLALRLCSGDAVIMTRQARRSWHGVPKVFGGEEHSPAWLRDRKIAGEEEGWRGWLRRGGRLNANVRQTFD